MARWGWIGLSVATALGPDPVLAECLGGCLDRMAAALASVAVYTVLGMVLLVMLIRAKWRRAGLWSLGVVALLALGVPLISQGWQAWKLYQMERREVVGTVPDLTGKTVLYIAPDADCLYTACEAVLGGRGGAGAYVLTLDALSRLDPSQPLVFADLPLEHWARPGVAGYEARRRVLQPDERRKVAARIDYLIASGWAYQQAGPGPLEAVLRQNPALDDMGQGEIVTLLMASLAPGNGGLSFADLTFDLLDLSLTDRALAIPLAPMNDALAANSAAGADIAIRALCPRTRYQTDPMCEALLDR